MKMFVYKYNLSRSVSCEIFLLPKNCQILKFDNQREIPTIWVLIDSEEKEQEEVVFYRFGTGWEIPSDQHLNYVGTALFDHGSLVWHLFIEGKEHLLCKKNNLI